MKKHILFLGIMTLLVSSCAVNNKIVTRGEQYSKLYEEKPLAIAIMPPINQTQHVEAKDYFYTTLYVPLCEKGYYVYSPMMTMEMFQSESAYDAEQFIEADLSQFRNVLGADAAMFTIIKSWKRDKLGGKLEAGVEYILRSCKTGETLYKREGLITVKKGSVDLVDAVSNPIGALLKVGVRAAKTAATDKVVAGRACTVYVLNDMPEGKYGTKFEQDKELPAGKSYVEAITE